MIAYFNCFVKALKRILLKSQDSPELVYKDIDQKIDVYAFAICMYETTTRQPAWNGHDQYEILQLVINNQRPEIPGDVLQLYEKSGWISIIQDCWDREPEKRPSFESLIFRISSLFLVENETLTLKVE